MIQVSPVDRRIPGLRLIGRRWNQRPIAEVDQPRTHTNRLFRDRECIWVTVARQIELASPHRSPNRIHHRIGITTKHSHFIRPTD
jgi:hypothetical protein